MLTSVNTQTIDFEFILIKNTAAHKIKYCKDKFIEKTEYEFCLNHRNYCRYLCDEAIYSRENIANYTCLKKCIRDYYERERLENILNANDHNLVESSVWVPKRLEKCDYKIELKDQEKWIECQVIDIKQNLNDPERKIVKITHKLSDNKIIESKINYPSLLLKKCGTKIQYRDDCNKQS